MHQANAYTPTSENELYNKTRRCFGLINRGEHIEYIHEIYVHSIFFEITRKEVQVSFCECLEMYFGRNCLNRHVETF